MEKKESKVRVRKSRLLLKGKPKTLGEYFYRTRTKKGITQVELADRCKVSQSHISKIESDDTIPDMVMAYKLMQHLDVDYKKIVPLIKRIL